MNDENTNIHFNSADEPIKHQKWQEKEEKRLGRGDGWRVLCFICGIIAIGGWMAIWDPVARTPVTFITALGSPASRCSSCHFLGGHGAHKRSYRVHVSATTLADRNNDDLPLHVGQLATVHFQFQRKHLAAGMTIRSGTPGTTPSPVGIAASIFDRAPPLGT